MAPTLPRRFCLSTSATWTSSSRRTPSSARCVHSRSPPHVGSRRPLRIASLARPPASAFSERTLNTSRRVARLLTTPLFFPRLPSLPSRARSGRSQRALSRRSWTSPTSERTRCAPLARPIRPHPPRDVAPHLTRVFHPPRGHPEGAWPRPRPSSRNLQHVAHYFPRAKRLTPSSSPPALSLDQEWIALQNLPSLPRDMSAVDLVDDDTAAPPVPPLSPPPARRAVAAAADGFPAGPAADPEHLDPDTVAYDDALRRAMTARARADEARRFATRKTATATALTMHARASSTPPPRQSGSKSRAARRSGPGLGQRPRPRRSARRVRKSLEWRRRTFRSAEDGASLVASRT